MTISLQDFASGDTNYVSKFNSNNDVLEAAIEALQALTSGAAASTISLASAYDALFGSSVAVIGDESYVCTDAGGSPAGNLSVTSGFCYRPSLTAVLSKASSTTLSFNGQSAGTYYVLIDSLGEPTRTDVSTEAIYSVVWTGSAFGAITLLANIVWGAADWIASQTSTALSASYTSLDDRLEAIETLVAGGGAVTSVGLSMPAEFSVSGSPVTSSGTLTATFAAQDSNRVLAGPTAGSPTTGVPTFRALVQADLPAQPYDVGGAVTGVPSASAVLMRYPFPRAVVFPVSLTLSRGVAGVAATAQTDFDLKKNGSSFGTMRFAAAGTTASFISAGGASFAAGDILTVVAPASPDATLSDVGFSLAGTR